MKTWVSFGTFDRPGNRLQPVFGLAEHRRFAEANGDLADGLLTEAQILEISSRGYEHLVRSGMPLKYCLVAYTILVWAVRWTSQMANVQHATE